MHRGMATASRSRKRSFHKSEEMLYEKQAIQATHPCNGLVPFLDVPSVSRCCVYAASVRWQGLRRARIARGLGILAHEHRSFGLVHVHRPEFGFVLERHA